MMGSTAAACDLGSMGSNTAGGDLGSMGSNTAGGDLDSWRRTTRCNRISTTDGCDLTRLSSDWSTVTG